MKKIILITLAVLTFSGVSLAQFEQGRILAGGSIGLSTHTYKSKNNNTTITTGKNFDFNFGPKVGYFVIDYLALGLGLNATNQTYKEEGGNYKNNSSSVIISPFVRYYLKPGIFFQGQFGIGSGKSKETRVNVTNTSKFNSSNWSLGAGYAWFLNNKVAIEPFLGYGADIRKSKGSDNKSIDSGLFINIGFQIYLDTKK